MNNFKKQEIAKVIIKVLKSRFDSFPEDANSSRNAPFHKAFLQAFSHKIDEAGSNVDAIISMSSWMHGLNTTLGQSFFESVAHILCDGEKKGFAGADHKIYRQQDQIISEIITDLKNGTYSPNRNREDALIANAASGEMVVGSNFTADCLIQDDDKIIAIELKSVRPNSGETRGEKQKILKAKAALRAKYTDKEVLYYFGFPFDPTAETDTGCSKSRFMSSIIEFSKFCAEDEILLADELWSFLSGEQNTMEMLLLMIRDIATEDFIEKFEFLCDSNNLIAHTQQYIELSRSWYLFDEVKIAQGLHNFDYTTKAITRQLNTSAFKENGEYNDRRAKILCDELM